MTIKDLTEQQKQALLDLTMLAMYADAHLASAEDQRVVRLLGLMGFATDYDREKHYDTSVSRVGRHSQTPRVFVLMPAASSRVFPAVSSGD